MAQGGQSHWKAGEPTTTFVEDTPSSEDPAERLGDAITGEEFQDWYSERVWAQNIKEGKWFFNGVSDPKPPRRHSPSQLLQCSRKIFYRQLNAPPESGEPTGIYWFGSELEEQLILDFLESVAGEEEYITNSIWVSFTENTDAGEIEIRGATDPVIVDREAEPVLITEVKSKRNLDNLQSPDRHHKAQTHAYMRGLTEKYDQEVSEAVIIYVSRTTLDLQSFRIPFDTEFWEEVVLDWIESHTTRRLQNELPDADPGFDWECNFCSYKERCGQGSSGYNDQGPVGFLPSYGDYPRENVVEHIEAHPGIKLTPTLAEQYPDLVNEFGVVSWTCPDCSSNFAWNKFSVGPSETIHPICPDCAEDGSLVDLRVPDPTDFEKQVVGTQDSEANQGRGDD